jgi:hypothetical protein
MRELTSILWRVHADQIMVPSVDQEALKSDVTAGIVTSMRLGYATRMGDRWLRLASGTPGNERRAMKIRRSGEIRRR